jgi:hypothetical protein
VAVVTTGFGNAPRDVRSLPVLSALLRGGRTISRVKRALRRGLRVPQMGLRALLSLLRLSRSARLCLRPRTLREPARATAVEPTRLRGRASATLRTSRATSANTTDILSARALGVRLERRLGRRGGASCAEPLLVLMRVQCLAVVRTG